MSVNHVSKRLGRALLNASKNLKLGGKGEGTLTKDKVLRLAHYFGTAIKEETTVEDMKRAILATLKHFKAEAVDGKIGMQSQKVLKRKDKKRVSTEEWSAHKKEENKKSSG
ncbi:hypothetical protein Pcinc_001936 [Petrolisthes cinctipes]|uniref:Uncharacterized protein n=1 Tax=Petrolisthes cinctipes TaxID=88211 RepID=A0AAE1L3G8_PETCI|nr:hypothetical protein Pcinc_002719 [Petrolisthes cinctipes]KAK3894293.1 hypothetical protein Pcinc_001936 [Petrolisthes cinctipes]